MLYPQLLNPLRDGGDKGEEEDREVKTKVRLRRSPKVNNGISPYDFSRELSNLMKLIAQINN